jgi:ATP-dependent Zn protease
LSDLAGMTEARQWGEATARDLALYKQGKLAWKDIDPGCLLYGPPGTGKTTYAKALAVTCGVALVATSFSEWQSANEGHLGTTMSAMKEAFDRAVKLAPCVLFIDELDSIPKRGGKQQAEYWTSFVNALLKEFDRIAEANGVIVVGACNHPELLDPALVRSGRMDRKIGIPMPSVADLAGIIRFHLGATDCAAIGDTPFSNPIARIALLCAGMSGADVEKTVRGARRVARNKGRSITETDFNEVLDPPSKRPDQATQTRIAIHEAGHVVAALKLKVSSEITASLISRDSSCGHIALRGGSVCKTQKDIDNLIVVALAGRAAEEMACGTASELSGGDNKDSDLARATRLASDAITKFGFSKHGRLHWHAAANHENVALRAGPLAEELKLMLDYAYQHAKSLMEDQSQLVRKIAEALLERRALSHADILSIASDDGWSGYSGPAQVQYAPGYGEDQRTPTHRPFQLAPPPVQQSWSPPIPVRAPLARQIAPPRPPVRGPLQPLGRS